MIAPTGPRRKGAMAKPARFRRDESAAMRAESTRHEIVSGILKLPNFRPSTALSDCKMGFLRWPGPFGSGFLSPQPPGVVGIGPVAEEFIRHWANASWSFFFLRQETFRGSAQRGERRIPERPSQFISEEFSATT
jgi:hypothetical protein